MGSATPPAVFLLRGQVVHARLRPAAHRFAYRLFWIMVDLDRLADASRVSPLFSAGRPNLVSFHERDHGPADGSPLRPHVEALLRSRGVDASGCSITLLCLPRVLGYAFNPLSIYFVRRPDGTPAATLYEVRNTFGERHTYVEAAGAPEPGRLDHRRPKAFRVSPFLPMAMTYRFAGALAGDRLRLRILACDGAGPVLATALKAELRPFTTRSLVAAVLALPLMTLKVVAAIHWEALRLWAKGVPSGRNLSTGTPRAGRPALEP